MTLASSVQPSRSELNGAASPANCARNIAGPLSVFITCSPQFYRALHLNFATVSIVHLFFGISGLVMIVSGLSPEVQIEFDTPFTAPVPWRLPG